MLVRGESRSGRRGLGVLALGVVVAATVLTRSNGRFFEPYFGLLHPVGVVALVALLGIALLLHLDSRGWFSISSDGEGWRRPALTLVGAGALAGLMVLLDVAVVFPEDMNVPLPEALLFYPVMGFVAEVVFHLLPITVVLLVLSLAFRSLPRDRTIWIALVCAALVEPAFQVAATWTDLPMWANGFLGVHLFVFSLAALWVFKRLGFFWLFGFRMAYYLVWHIVWGAVRLRVLV